MLPVETILTDAIPGTARWLPAQLLESIAQGGTTTAPFAAALVTVSAYVLGAAVIATLVFAAKRCHFLRPAEGQRPPPGVRLALRPLHQIA